MEVVGKGDSMALGDFKDLVLAVGEEGSPLDLACGASGSPVVDDLLALVADRELTTCGVVPRD